MTSAAVRFGQRVSDFNVIGARLRDSGETTRPGPARRQPQMDRRPFAAQPRGCAGTSLAMTWRRRPAGARDFFAMRIINSAGCGRRPSAELDPTADRNDSTNSDFGKGLFDACQWRGILWRGASGRGEGAQGRKWKPGGRAACGIGLRRPPSAQGRVRPTVRGGARFPARASLERTDHNELRSAPRRDMVDANAFDALTDRWLL